MAAAITAHHQLTSSSVARCLLGSRLDRSSLEPKETVTGAKEEMIVPAGVQGTTTKPVPEAKRNESSLSKEILSELATLEEIVGPRQITRENNQRFITVQCNVRGRDIGSFVEEARL